ncbi:transketolase [Endothiovibrio diazotrophicus]
MANFSVDETGVEDFKRLSQEVALDDRSRDLRRLVLLALEGGGRGHLGSSMSLIEILRALYDDFLNYRVDDPRWTERDRCILSKGHGCLALYALLADKGFISREQLRGFCSSDTVLGGHPELGKIPGVEASTGALGHGLSIGVGMALAARMEGRSSRVVVVTGDGELNEGSVWEAALSAAKHRLENFSVMVDYNKLQSYGPVDEVLALEPLADKWRAFGFACREINGHDVSALREALGALPFEPGRPSVIICHTVKGKGFPFAEFNPLWHHKSRISAEDIAEMQSALDGYQ